MFKVGDIVTGKAFCGYRVTNEYSTCLVEKINGDRMTIKLIRTQQKDRDGEIGCSFHVNVGDFLLLEEAKVMEVKEEVW